MTSPYEAAEVRAAKAGKVPRPAGAEIIPVHAPVGPPLDALLEQMIDAEEVFIVGVLPWECSRRLIDLQRERREAGTPPAPKKVVHYFIPERDAGNSGATMGPRIQRWIAGLFGVRNWVVPHRDEQANVDSLIIRLYKDDTGGRVVLTRKGDRYQATTLLYLPHPQLPSDGVLTVAAFDAAQTEQIRKEVVERLLPLAQSWAIRQVRCYGPGYQDSGDPFQFTRRLMRLTKERGIDLGETEPAAVVAICGRTYKGPVVVLKQRHRSNSADDFDRLSLISEHVIEEDLITWTKNLQQPLSTDDQRALNQLWIAAKRPKEMILEEQFFAMAAQRELFLSCGLNVDLNRLKFCGYRLIKREEKVHLGFAVFRLDLIQDDDLDELEIVTQWSRDMVPILLKELYDRPDMRLNRLLQMQRDWLIEKVFTDDRPEDPR
ncbi:MAG: hypothetical protein ABW156_14025 [Jiangellaceae bacterium]